ncbi:hypothetical protein EVAR_29666_1 [Eumeta japonica]|uniref:Uncharacterized protein n=1 Tax=Eumeta variegata TaxID=151549 RepID=A0A4C1W7S3_EUMVA|nr:hypothetical protein EVAR_29666_1 [Eumeta japonica]
MHARTHAHNVCACAFPTWLAPCEFFRSQESRTRTDYAANDVHRQKRLSKSPDSVTMGPPRGYNLLNKKSIDPQLTKLSLGIHKIRIQTNIEPHRFCNPMLSISPSLKYDKFRISRPKRIRFNGTFTATVLVPRYNKKKNRNTHVRPLINPDDGDDTAVPSPRITSSPVAPPPPEARFNSGPG